MLKSKKGVMGWSRMTTYIILGVILLIMVAIYDGAVTKSSDSFFKTMGKHVVNFVDIFIGQEDTPDGDDFVTAEIQKSFDDLILDFKNVNRESKDCYVPFQSISLDDLEIHMLKTDTGSNFILYNRKKQELGNYKIEGLYPCLVAPDDPNIDDITITAIISRIIAEIITHHICPWHFFILVNPYFIYLKVCSK